MVNLSQMPESIDDLLEEVERIKSELDSKEVGEEFKDDIKVLFSFNSRSLS